MNPKRRSFQIHLSTGVVLMLVAGALLWLNTQESRQRFYPQGQRDWWIKYGWPFTCKDEIRRYEDPFPENKKMYVVVRTWSAINTLGDAAVAFVILFTVWLICERFHRHAARKANE